MKLTTISGFKSTAIRLWRQQHLTQGSDVISDGLACFDALVDAGCVHDKLACGGGRASVEEPEFYWVTTILGNVKRAALRLACVSAKIYATLPLRVHLSF